MSETPRFQVIDRRKMKADEERETRQQPAPAASQAATAAATPAAGAEPAPGPRLVANEPRAESAAGEAATKNADLSPEGPSFAAEMPPPPTAEETSEQKAAYDESTQRLEELIRAQNPAAGPQPPVGFEHLVQQIYLTAMLQMGAVTQEGQRPRVDIVGARSTVDLIGVLAERTRGNLSAAEDRMLQTVLFEARMAFLELTSTMTVQPVTPAPKS